MLSQDFESFGSLYFADCMCLSTDRSEEYPAQLVVKGPLSGMVVDQRMRQSLEDRVRFKIPSGNKTGVEFLVNSEDLYVKRGVGAAFDNTMPSSSGKTTEGLLPGWQLADPKNGRTGPASMAMVQAAFYSACSGRIFGDKLKFFSGRFDFLRGFVVTKEDLSENDKLVSAVMRCIVGGAVPSLFPSGSFGSFIACNCAANADKSADQMLKCCCHVSLVSPEKKHDADFAAQVQKMRFGQERAKSVARASEKKLRKSTRGLAKHQLPKGSREQRSAHRLPPVGIRP